MDFSDLQDEIEQLRPEGAEPEGGMETLMANLGEMAAMSMRLTDDIEDAASKELIDELRRELLAGVLLSAMEYAAEHGLDVEKAMEERLEEMRDRREQQQEIDEAIEDGDARALADAMDSEQNEVPTGDTDDDDEPRYIG